MLLLVVGAIAGGCSRDGPLVAPEIGTVEALEAPAAAAAAPDPLTADAVDDALTRLAPALGSWGVPLSEALARLQARRNDKSAQADLKRAVEAVALVLPDTYRPDFDALRLELGLIASK